MATDNQDLKQLLKREYSAGFFTDIEVDKAPVGLK